MFRVSLFCRPGAACQLSRIRFHIVKSSHPLRFERQGRAGDRLDPRHRQVDRRGAGARRRQGGGVAAARRRPASRRRRSSRSRASRCSPGPATSRARRSCRRWSTPPRRSGARIDIVVANAATNPYYGPLTGISDEAFDKIVANNVKSVLWLAAHDAARHGEPRRRQLHRGRLDRRHPRQHRDRRLRHLQGRRPPPGAQPGGRMGAEERARQRHRARAGEDRVRARAVGRREARRRARFKPRRCGAWASRAISAASRYSSPRRPRHSSPDSASSPTAALPFCLPTWISTTPPKSWPSATRCAAWLAANLPQDLREDGKLRAPLEGRPAALAPHPRARRAGSRRPGRRSGAAPAGTWCSATSSRRSSATPARPPLIPFGLTMCAPVLLAFGTEAQKKRFLPRIYNGDDFWCQGYSEPGSGSDLASLKTRADQRRRPLRRQRPEDLDHARALRRLDLLPGAHRPDGEKRQEGISFLLIDMKTPGHHRAAADPDGRRPRGERGVLRRREGAGRRTWCTRRARAGRWPSTCSATSA